MFWKFDLHTTSHIDTLLEREDIPLFEVLDEEDVLQECKVTNRKLVDFLIRPQNMTTLVNSITEEPPCDVDEKIRFKYPNISCEILTADVSQITDALGEDETLLNKLYNFLLTDNTLNPLLASFFSKVMGILINRKTEQIVSFLRKKDDFVGLLLKHIGTSAIMDLLLRLLTCVEPPQLRQDVFSWLNEEKIVQRLIDMIHPSRDDDQHSNASQSLCDIIRLSRDQMIQIQDSPEPDQLLATLEKQETIEQLLSNMLEGSKVESVLVNGILVLLTLLEPRRSRSEMGGFFCNVDGQLEISPPGPESSSSQASIGTLLAIKHHLREFHQLLLEPPKKESLLTTFGVLDPPLGNTRLHVVKLFASLMHANNPSVNQELMDLNVLSTMMDLYFTYVYNNFLHSQVEQCISTLLNTPAPEEEVENSGEIISVHQLIRHLLQKCQLTQRILCAWEENEKEQSEGGKRKGYMGHLTKVANALVQSSEKGPNSALILQLIKDLKEDEQEQWEKFVSGALSEVNKKNMVDLVSENTVTMPICSDDEEGDLKEFNFPQEAVLQQAFVDYQMQQMTSNFVDNFGFNDEEFGEQEQSVQSAFNRATNVNFSLNADDENPNSNLFELCYKEKIQQFDDEDEGSDGEDIWQDKEVRFSAGTVQCVSQRSSDSTDRDGSRDSEEDDDEDDDDDDEDNQSSGRNSRKSSSGSVTEKTEEEDDRKEDHGWAAHFDAVPMDMDSSGVTCLTVTDSGSSVWDTPESISSSGQGEGWAVFTEFPREASLQEVQKSISPAAVENKKNVLTQEETKSNISSQQNTTESLKASILGGQQQDPVSPAGPTVKHNAGSLTEENREEFERGSVALNGDMKEAANSFMESMTILGESKVFEGNLSSTSEAAPAVNIVPGSTEIQKCCPEVASPSDVQLQEQQLENSEPIRQDNSKHNQDQSSSLPNGSTVQTLAAQQTK